MISDYIRLIKNHSLSPQSKNILLNGLFSLLDICTELQYLFILFYMIFYFILF